MLHEKLKSYRNEATSEEGFTLIELMIVVVIIGILAAIAVPVFMNQQKAAIEATAKTDLKSAATVMATESTKLGGKFPGVLPSTVTTSDGIVLSLASGKTGPLYSNPALTTPEAGRWSWAETETNFKINTGEVGIIRPRNLQLTVFEERTFYYPRTGGSLKQATQIFTSYCNDVNVKSKTACNSLLVSLPTLWENTLNTGSVLSLAKTFDTNNPTIFSANVFGIESSLLGNWPGMANAPYLPTWPGTTTRVPQRWAFIPSEANTNPTVWGTPANPDTAPAGGTQYCLNVTHETITDIKYHYDSNEGKVKEGSCV